MFECPCGRVHMKCTYLYARVCLRAYMCVCVCVCVCVRVPMCVYVCMCVGMYVRVYPMCVWFFSHGIMAMINDCIISNVIVIGCFIGG